jgi:hypothetical protein
MIPSPPLQATQIVERFDQPGIRRPRCLLDPRQLLMKHGFRVIPSLLNGINASQFAQRNKHALVARRQLIPEFHSLLVRFLSIFRLALFHGFVANVGHLSDLLAATHIHRAHLLFQLARLFPFSCRPQLRQVVCEPDLRFRVLFARTRIVKHR